MNFVTAVVLVYVAASLGIGVWVGRRVRTEDDYLVAGRTLGYGLGTFTIMATWFGAETCIGAAGAIYEEGLSGGSADPFGYGMCLLLMGGLFAARLWRMGLSTLGDFFRQRFSPAVERLAVLLIIPTSILWAAAQIRAFGQVLSISSGHAVPTTITVAAIVVVIYTAFGGVLADAWTDLFQGIALIVGLVVLLVAVGARHGLEPFTALEPERLRIVGSGTASALDVLEAWSIPVLGSLFSAEMVARVLAMRAPHVARRATLFGASLYVVIGLIPASLGLIGPRLMPGLAEPEQLLPLLAHELLPPLAAAIFAGALVSAILSTVDSALLAAASLASHNLVVSLRPHTTDRQKVLLARAGVALAGALAYVLALWAEGVYALVEEASAFGSGGVVVVMLFGMAGRFGGPASAVAALVAGLAAWVGGAYVLALEHPYLVSLLVSALAYAVVASGTMSLRRSMLALALVSTGIVGATPPPPPDPTICYCMQARAINGWCEVHARGFVAAVPIRSKLLWEALDAHGHEVDPTTFHCPSCQEAIAGDGFCEEHRVGFVHGLAYFSRLTYELGRGHRTTPESLTCAVCRRHAETHGWCEACRRGMVGSVAILDRTSYDRVTDELGMLDLANAAAERCEYCAIAIVTDADCPFCHIHYRDGRAVPAPEAP